MSCSTTVRPGSSRGTPRQSLVLALEDDLRSRLSSGRGWPARAEIAQLLQRWGGAERDAAWVATHEMYDRIGREVAS